MTIQDMQPSDRPSVHRPIIHGLAMATLLMTAAVVLKISAPDFIATELASRVQGGLLGIVVVAYANAVPKILPPLMHMRNNPSAALSIRRFTGWSLTLGGMFYALSWLVMPHDYANVMSASLLGAALLLVVIRLQCRGLSCR